MHILNVRVCEWCIYIELNYISTTKEEIQLFLTSTNFAYNLKPIRTSLSNLPQCYEWHSVRGWPEAKDPMTLPSGATIQDSLGPLIGALVMESEASNSLSEMLHSENQRINTVLLNQPRNSLRDIIHEYYIHIYIYIYIITHMVR